MSDDNRGAEWLRACGKEVGPVGERVARLVDWWQDGIYHIEHDALRADWSHPHYVALVVYGRSGRLATFDFGSLTRLVFGAHDHCIRVEITSANWSHLRIMFHPRDTRNGFTMARHPTLEHAVATPGMRSEYQWTEHETVSRKD